MIKFKEKLYQLEKSTYYLSFKNQFLISSESLILIILIITCWIGILYINLLLIVFFCFNKCYSVEYHTSIDVSLTSGILKALLGQLGVTVVFYPVEECIVVGEWQVWLEQ